MEYLNKLNEFGNYLLSINNDESKKSLFHTVLFKNCMSAKSLTTWTRCPSSFNYSC